MKEEDVQFLDRVSQQLDTRESHDDTFYFIEMYEEFGNQWTVISPNLTAPEAMQHMTDTMNAARGANMHMRLRIIEMRTSWSVRKEVTL